MNQRNGGKRKGKDLDGIKALLSVSALTATLVGWGLLAKDASQNVVQTPPADVGALLNDILGPLPTLPTPQSVTNQDQTQNAAPTLRPVSLPAQSAQSAAQPAPVTNTQSSR